MKEIEILAPAGSYDCLKAAINAGADAVYLGGNLFGARAFAENFSKDELLEAIDYVHLFDKKIYLTVNTLLKNNEINDELYHYILPLYQHGLDAVIVQDIGVLNFIKKHFPDLPIHASTQMTITSLSGAKFLENLGVDRVVTSRELQLEEIKEISKHTNLEIESFVHGALCYCYSGQCLYSSLIGGRSGNRGQCAQPCRLPYSVKNDERKQYLLSLKDICTIDMIPELIESGIHSFKIEGRMKKPEYVALVTKMYRKYVNLYLNNCNKEFKVDKKDIRDLMDMYNRGGFHGGYYKKHNGREMVSISRPNHAGVEVLRVMSVKGRNIKLKALKSLKKGDIIELPEPRENYTISAPVGEGDLIEILAEHKQNLQNGTILNRVRNESLIQEIKNNIIDKKTKRKIDGVLTLSNGERIHLKVNCGKYFAESFGAVCELPKNQPTSKERVAQQVNKTGNTDFQFENLTIEMDQELFVPMQELNEVRRNALELLKNNMVNSYRRNNQIPLHHAKCERKQTSYLESSAHVLVKTYDQFYQVLQFDFVKRIYIDSTLIKNIWKEDGLCCQIIKEAHQKGMSVFLALPHVFRSKTQKLFSESRIFDFEWDGMLIRNYEEYQFLNEKQYSKCIIADYQLYSFNDYAKQFWQETLGCHTTAPLELNKKELCERGLDNTELVVYGYQPMMISAQCIQKTLNNCKKDKGIMYIKDRYNKSFAVSNECDYCYNIIYNSLPFSLLDYMDDIYSLSPNSVRIELSIESKEETANILNCFLGKSSLNCDFTRGHYKRGIK